MAGAPHVGSAQRANAQLELAQRLRSTGAAGLITERCVGATLKEGAGADAAAAGAVFSGRAICRACVLAEGINAGGAAAVEVD
jgi:hypothetical protein